MSMTQPTTTERIAEEADDDEERIEMLEEQVESQAERIDDLEREVEQMKSLMMNMNQKISEVESDAKQRMDVLENRMDATVEGLDDVEDEVERLSDSATVEFDARAEASLTTIERLAIFEEEAVECDVTATVERALTIVENYKQLRTARDKHTYAIQANPRQGASVKNVLEVIRDEELSWTQVYRTMEKLAALGGDKMEYAPDKKLVVVKDDLILTEEDLREQG